MRRRWTAALVLCVGQLMIVLDGTVVTVALPSIQRSLHFSQADLAWVVNAYLITFAGFLLLAGRTGDLFGRRKVFLTGLVIFTLASLACGLAGTQALLIGGRFIQGIGGAISSSVVLGILVTEFPDGRERAKAIGLYTFVAATGGSAGLVLGGVVTQAIDWHWIFFINLPIGVLVLLAGRALIDEDERHARGKRVDVLGAVLITAALMLAAYAIVKASEFGWTSAHTLALDAGAIGLLAAFVSLERRLRDPLVPPRVLLERDLGGANLIRGLLVCAVTGQFFVGALFLQRLLHYSATDAGLAYLPLTVILGPLALLVTTRLIARIGPKATLIPGQILVILGLLAMARAPLHARYLTDILPAMILLGLGQGLAFLPTVTLAMLKATAADSGLRSGLVNVSQQMGAALGVAILASVSTSETSRQLQAGHTRASALLNGYHLGYVVAAAFVLAGLILTLLLVRPKRSELAISPDRAVITVPPAGGTETSG